jgi:hypothetical protein
MGNRPNLRPDVIAKVTCYMCHRKRAASSMDGLRCRNRQACLSVTFGALRDGTPAQAEALRLSGKKLPGQARRTTHFEPR